MTATGRHSKNGRKHSPQQESRKTLPLAAAGARTEEPSAAPPSDPRENFSDQDVPEAAPQQKLPVRVKSRAAARRIRGLAERTATLEPRRLLRRLADQVAAGSRSIKGIAAIEATMGECLDEAAVAGTAGGRWLVCEGATWALAWLARTKRAGVAAGGLLERLVREARSAQEALRSRDCSSAQFVVALSRLFCDLEACRSLESDAADALDGEIKRLVTAEGMVLLSGSQEVVERVAEWAAVREVARATGNGSVWGGAAEERFAGACGMALRLLGDAGRGLTRGGPLPATATAMLLAAAEGASGKLLRRTAQRHLQVGGSSTKTKTKSKTKAKTKTVKNLLPRAIHCAAAQAAVIRTGWGSGSLRVLLEYRSAVPRLEIAAGDRLLAQGDWTFGIEMDGHRVEVAGPWKVACFESDSKATYLEISAPLPGGMQLERQVVVLPRDRIVLLADSITTSEEAVEPRRPQEIVYEATVPLVDLQMDRADESREILGSDTAPRLTALPLALPEWCSSRGAGELAVATEGLRLRQQGQGGRIFAPVWLDLDPCRMGSQLTWRQLSVADSRLNLARHEAVGFRVQVGLEQWLLYRALDTVRNRTVLGCNLACHFLIGRIGRRGQILRLMEIG